MSELKSRIAAATTAAMRARQRDRVKALRLVNAAIKQTEIDGRRDLGDADVVAVLAKMRKQRDDSLGHYVKAGREDLAAIERFEKEVIEEFMPQPPSADEIDAAVHAAIAATGASGPRDMGKVMGHLKAELAAGVDLGAVSRVVRAALTAA